MKKKKTKAKPKPKSKTKSKAKAKAPKPGSVATNRFDADGTDRRRSQRKEVLETFQVFLVIPNRGFRKIALRDISEHGLSFIVDADFGDFDKYREGDHVESFFYINPSLKLPLSFNIVRVTEKGATLQIGCEITDTESTAFKAYGQFVRLLDDLSAFLEAPNTP